MNSSKLLERFVFFSDAVFAIAITLLVVELGVPHIGHGPDEVNEALRLLRDRIPNFIGFGVSFAVIGAFWAMHHRVFGMLSEHGQSLVWPNLLLLMAIAFLPFSTAFMSENMGELVPHLFYLGSLLLAGLLQVRLVRRALGPAHLAPQADLKIVRTLRRRIWALPIVTVAGMALCFVTPVFSIAALLALPLVVRLLVRT